MKSFGAPAPKNAFSGARSEACFGHSPKKISGAREVCFCLFLQFLLVSVYFSLFLLFSACFCLFLLVAARLCLFLLVSVCFCCGVVDVNLMRQHMQNMSGLGARSDTQK